MLSKSLFLALFAAFLAPSLSRAQPVADSTLRDIVYGHAGGHDLKLDLYLPSSTPPGGKGSPVVIYIHGGGWRVGSKAEGEQYARMFTSNGIAFASIDYRLSNDAMLARADSRCQDRRALGARQRPPATAWTPRAIGVFGASAGGHLVALLGTTEGVKALEDRSQGSPRESSRVRAVCDVSGPVDMIIPTHRFVGKLAVRWEFGGSAAEKPDLVRQADPSLYVKGGEPPFLIIQGDADELVVPANATKLEAALKAHGDTVHARHGARRQAHPVGGRQAAQRDRGILQKTSRLRAFRHGRASA